MPDQLNLSLWLRDFSAAAMLRRFEETLRLFPFSHIRPGIRALRIYALEFAEPALLEQSFPEETGVDHVIELCREFENADCSYIVEGSWELWKYEGRWQLTPSPVALSCFGPDFQNETGDHLRVELGADTDFLPSGGIPESLRKSQSNLASVVRLVRDLEAALPVERRSLWSESGENFAERLDEALDEAS